jgi:hypothetical protein
MGIYYGDIVYGIKIGIYVPSAELYANFIEVLFTESYDKLKCIEILNMIYEKLDKNEKYNYMFYLDTTSTLDFPPTKSLAWCPEPEEEFQKLLKGEQKFGKIKYK